MHNIPKILTFFSIFVWIFLSSNVLAWHEAQDNRRTLPANTEKMTEDNNYGFKSREEIIEEMDQRRALYLKEVEQRRAEVRIKMDQHRAQKGFKSHDDIAKEVEALRAKHLKEIARHRAAIQRRIVDNRVQLR